MKYRKGYKYQLAETELFWTYITPREEIVTEFLHLRPNGVLSISSGYAWDGPSGPTIDTENTRRGTLFHDAAYQLMRMELLDPEWRGLIDQELGRFLVLSGMSKVRAWVWVKGLKWFGGPAADPENRRQVFEAP